MLSTLNEIIEDLQNGNMVIVSDSQSRENEGDLILPAQYANENNIGFFIRYTSGIVCVAVTSERAEQLELPQMVKNNEEKNTTAFTVSVDAKYGISTGISAADRALTIQLLANENTQPFDLVRPGHIFPLQAVDGLLGERLGHTEAAVHLLKEANLESVGVLAEIVDDQGNPIKGQDLFDFAKDHDLSMITIEEIVNESNLILQG